MNRIEKILLVISNVLLWGSLAFRNKLIQNIAWIFWVLFLILEVRREKQSNFKRIVYGVLAVLIILILIHSTGIWK